MTTALSLRIFPHSGKTPAQAETALAVAIAASCVVSPIADLRFIRSDPVSSRYCSEAVGASHPIADDRT